MPEKLVKSYMVPETGAALFNSPTSSSNSEANTEEGNLIAGESSHCHNENHLYTLQLLKNKWVINCVGEF
uniref:Uncharacterized protein n=1 Tax=Pelusios castaneus TaxID=367368 RepID=A0A8C8RYX8_9SAUR